jgi:hypothetical protein
MTRTDKLLLTLVAIGILAATLLINNAYSSLAAKWTGGISNCGSSVSGGVK